MTTELGIGLTRALWAVNLMNGRPRHAAKHQGRHLTMPVME